MHGTAILLVLGPHTTLTLLALVIVDIEALRCVRLEYSGIRIYSGIYSGYSAPGSRIAGMEIQLFRNENSSQTNAYSHYSNYSYSGLIPNERALTFLVVTSQTRITSRINVLNVISLTNILLDEILYILLSFLLFYTIVIFYLVVVSQW